MAGRTTRNCPPLWTNPDDQWRPLIPAFMKASPEFYPLSTYALGGMSLPSLPPLGKRVAVASDDAFRFSNSHVLDGWRRTTAEISPFSPLRNRMPK